MATLHQSTVRGRGGTLTFNVGGGATTTAGAVGGGRFVYYLSQHTTDVMVEPLVRRVLLLTLATLCVTSASHAKEQERRVHVIEQRPFLLSLRAEIAPQFAYTMNEVLFHYIQASGTFRFHIDEQWAVGLTYSHYFSSITGKFESVQETFGVFPETVPVRWFAGAEVNYTPIYGKFILFDSWIVHWNAWLSAGAGVTQTGVDNFHPTGTVGVGARLFLTPWLAMHIEFKDHIYNESFKAGSELINNFVVQTGFGFFFPDFEYRYQK